MFFNRKKKQEPVENLADLALTAARKGDTVSVLAMGDDYEDLDFTVDRVSYYEGDPGERWTEVSGVYRGTRIFLEVWDEPGVDVILTRESDEISFRSLGLGEPDLVRLDETKDTSVEIGVDGVRFRFSESGEALYFEDGSREGEGYYEWVFEEVEGPRELYVEKWEGEPFEASLGRKIQSGDCRVFRR